MELSRYTFSDAYILEELRLEYQTSDAKGRISLLKKLYKDDRAAPFEIALLAVEDQHVEVRQWIARHSKHLNYSHDEPSRPNLEDRLKNDPDPFVRACLRENPTVFDAWSSTAWMEYFLEATHLERLALMRNPEVGSAHGEDLIQKIFDHEDQELGIDLEARKELVLAFLTNTQAVSQSRRLKAKDFFTTGDTGDALSWVGTRHHFSELWKLISKWSKGTGNLQHAVYRYVGAPDETKAEIYRTCDVPVWRRAILENCNEGDSQTIELGMKDEDKAVLWGLAQNRSLSLDQLRKVRDRLGELGDTVGVELAEWTIKELQKTRVPENPEELLGKEGGKGQFLEEKIEFIGKTLLSLEHEVTKRLNLLPIGVAIAAGVALLALADTNGTRKIAEIVLAITAPVALFMLILKK